MKKDDKASISLRKIIAISIILLFIMGIAVMAANSKVNNVKIILSNGYEINVLTSKTNVSKILDENHITLLSNEVVTPALEEEISDNRTIRISEGSDEISQTSSQIESSENITAEKLLAENYSSIIEKVVTEQVAIPYETETKDVSTGTGNKIEVVTQIGIDGLKEVTYKIKYQNDVEIERTEVSSVIIKEATNKIVELRTSQVTSRTDTVRTTSTSTTSLASKVEGITPSVVNMNTSGYCSCASCCGKSNGITASGAKATEWYTIAAGGAYPLGTIIYIPYFADQPNGGWFVVQDRGGAISNKRIDVYFGSHSQALSFGRHTLECYVYEF